MNTVTVLTKDAEQFRSRLFDLMFEDGFGFDEAISHASDYAREIFGKASKTGVMRVKAALRRAEKEVTQ